MIKYLPKTRKGWKLFAVGIIVILAIMFNGIQMLLATTFIQTPNVGTGELTFNRAVACSQTTNFCYLMGGGADIGSLDNDVHIYDRVANTYSSGTGLPQDDLFSYYASGSYDNLIVAFSSWEAVTYVYNESTNSYTTVDPSGIINTGFGYTGTTVDSQFYVFTNTGSGIEVYRLDLENPSDNYDLITVDITTPAGYSMQWAKSVYDPESGSIVIFARDDGLMVVYDVASATFEYPSDTFAPCDAINVCQPSLAFYDAELGILAGQVGDPSATSIGLYQYTVDGSDSEFSVTTVETLSNANFTTSGEFASGSGFQAPEGYVTDPDTNITYTLFGGAKTTSTSPGFTANQYWFRTGDSGGVVTVERDVYSWLDNFLTSIHMNSTFGKLLVGVIFSSVIVIVLFVLRVPPLFALGAGGMASVFLVVGQLMSPNIFLALAAILMFSGFVAVIGLLAKGGDDG